MRHASETPADQLIRIAEEVPGFGGMFYDENSSLSIYLLNPDQADDVGRVIAALHDDLTPGRVKVFKGQYSYLQLREWYWLSGKLLRMKGAVFMVIDETRNRVVFGVEKGNMNVREHIERKLAQLAVPREAIVVEEVDPLVQYSIPGGAQHHPTGKATSLLPAPVHCQECWRRTPHACSMSAWEDEGCARRP